MKIFQRYFFQCLPARKDLLRFFLVVCIPIHIWAWLIFFYDLPGYLLRLSIWQISVVLAYVLVYTLFESIIATLLLTLLIWLFPFRLRANGYSLQGSVFLLVAVLVSIFIHMQRTVIISLNLNVTIYLLMIGLVSIASLAILISLSWALRHQPKVAERMLAFLDRLNIIAVVYLALDGLAVCLTALRILTAVIS